MAWYDITANLVPGGDLLKAGTTAAMTVQQAKEAQDAANAAAAINQAALDRELRRSQAQYGGSMTDAGYVPTDTGVETVRAKEDYAAKMDEFKRSQHLQNLMKREQLAQRGITTPTGSSIGQSEWGQVGAEQTAAGKGIESWRARKLADIGTMGATQQENIMTQKQQVEASRKAGQFSWADILREAKPAAIAGGVEGGVKVF